MYTPFEITNTVIINKELINKVFWAVFNIIEITKILEKTYIRVEVNKTSAYIKFQGEHVYHLSKLAHLIEPKSLFKNDKDKEKKFKFWFIKKITNEYEKFKIEINSICENKIIKCKEFWMDEENRIDYSETIPVILLKKIKNEIKIKKIWKDVETVLFFHLKIFYQLWNPEEKLSINFEKTCSWKKSNVIKKKFPDEKWKNCFCFSFNFNKNENLMDENKTFYLFFKLNISLSTKWYWINIISIDSFSNEELLKWNSESREIKNFVLFFLFKNLRKDIKNKFL